ncbi:MAG: MFS transporter [Chromatiales bacterium]|nr:MFS transporter [Chromatiales bacterium]
MLVLGFSSGLPFPLVFTTLTAWLTTTGVSKSQIGMFAWAGIAYSVKFAWAPLVDRLGIPGLTAWFGRRRSWMLLSQCGVIAVLLLMSVTDPAARLTQVALLTVVLAVCSATQDIAVDAWRIEAVAERLQGAMAAAYQVGYRTAVLVAGAGALYIADLGSWGLAYQVMAALMLPGVLTALLVAEPAVAIGVAGANSLTDWFSTAVVGPFREFFQRVGGFGFVLLLFIGSYRISDMVLGVMANPFYIDTGFSLSEIATVTKVFGFGITLVGAALGGVAVARYGAARPLVVGAILLAASNLVFIGLAQAGPDLGWLIAAICADNLAAGFVGTIFIAYLSSLTNVAYTATQYALFTSLMSLPGRLLSGFSGQVVEMSGWVNFFIYTTAAGIPAVLLAMVVVRRQRKSG